MKRFNRPTTAQILGRNAPESAGHPEPQGHVHPNYRYLTWFRPHDSQANGQ
ncbi:MAG: hypothetical protein NW224_11600 [Leptolyngbyaceae cyanobacterium bins.302]|nr:hypothetical protein [Leptolyngbyaceae cyanobacterium bins.302]